MKLFCALVLIVMGSNVFAKDEKVSKKIEVKNSAVDFRRLAQAEPEVPEKPSQGKTRKGKKVIKLQPDEVIAGSSEDYRQNKMFSLTWEILGFIPFPSTGGALGYYLTPDNILEFSQVSGKWNMRQDERSSRLRSLRLKTFWDNSFYTNLGLSSRLTHYSEYDSITSDYKVARITNEVLGVELAIGNRWQWDYFTIGCDWFGIFAPIAQTGTSRVHYESSDYSDEFKANLDENYLSRTVGAEMLRFYIGISL